MPDLRIETAALTDKGRLRPGNEDAVAVFSTESPRRVALIVADGVGGLKEGGFASQSVVKGVRAAFDSCDGDLVECMSDAMEQVNGALYARSGGDETRLSGSTVVALALQAPGVTVLYAGDSRAYLLREGTLIRLTRDHSWVNEQVDAGLLTDEEAASSPNRNIITRCLGVEPSVVIDRREVGALRVGDIFLLSSDGLHTVVPATEIAQVLAAPATLDSIAATLVSAANAAGGPDNISVALARIVAI